MLLWLWCKVWLKLKCYFQGWGVTFCDVFRILHCLLGVETTKLFVILLAQLVSGLWVCRWPVRPIQVCKIVWQNELAKMSNRYGMVSSTCIPSRGVSFQISKTMLWFAIISYYLKSLQPKMTCLTTVFASQSLFFTVNWQFCSSLFLPIPVLSLCI